jgi:hypothetical protein
MEQTEARMRAKELNDSGLYDSTFVAMTKSHLKGQWETDSPIWVVVEMTPNGSSMRVVEE